MKLYVSINPQELGEKAASHAADELNKAISEQGYARLLVSTGASQFETLSALIKKDIDWKKVEMFHLDEYVNLPENHIASFRKYLKERFVQRIPLKKAHLVNGEGDIKETIKLLTEEIRKQPIDVALIGIGENAHIAFNDPPADFDTKEAYIVVELDDKCKEQQVREGWFKIIEDVPKTAISMSVYQIMQSKIIISSVPHLVKAKAVKDTLESDLTNTIPATMLKQHDNWHLYLDESSSSLIDHKQSYNSLYL
ncbi:glucosamine-6-phosphate deaminase [Natronincola ferrireducens]|uniref:Glucosamine-6-phosphate deaminase n=1 Tax=Natronincola ferrireducens TaxID=393762 RepID=A0A1G8YRD5_9FIRM|nr:glucosamine-6-phosphate deaminase [Natronincola ferrireducens]SDK05409.1 glucosamine-6-phosphate deaminase [Natronincola ferrireducens]